MSRIPSIPIEKYDGDQKSFFNELTGSKRSMGGGADSFLTPERGLKGPFNPWAYHPKLGIATQRLGEMLRFEGKLPAQLREIAILVGAAHWHADYEWWAHEKIARGEGLEPDIIESIKTGKRPDFKDSEKEVVFEFSVEVLKTNTVSDGMYRKAVSVLGETKVVELVILLGYYTIISMTLNVFNIPAPGGEEPLMGVPDQTE